LKMLTETRLRIPFSVIGRCYLVPAYHGLEGKCARINLSQAVSGMILQNHRRLPIGIFSSVPNPDPPDPHVFGPQGSGSTSQRYGSGSGSGSFYH
jgi:hypothetical protein